ncbi:hypothetical protein ACKWTF_000632 [Chironomus riparius]
MKKISQIFLLFVILLRSSLCIEIKNGTTTAETTTFHYLQNELIPSTKMPSIEKSDNINLSNNHHHHKKNSSLKVAESRLFPVGHPGLIAQPGSLVSPFDVAAFSNSLLPLITAGIREKVKDMTTAFNDGFDYVEDSIRDGWRESPLNPYNYEKILNNPPNLLEHLSLPNLGNHIAPHYPHPAHHKHPKASHKSKTKAPNHPIESYSSDEMMHEFGINGYKHFEESILREIEKQEELKVEATIHTLFGKDEKIEIVRGRPYDAKLEGWKPVAAPTKIYDDSNEITSQIISPLHTSFIHAADAIGSDFDTKTSPIGFHDFDHFNNNVYSSYGVQEGGESMVKPVKSKITPVRRITPVPPIYSTVATTTPATKRYSSSSTTLRSRSTTTASNNNNRKRQNVSTAKPIVDEKSNKVSDTSTSSSNAVPVFVSANIKRLPSRIHIQSLTTSKPKNHSNIVRSLTPDSSAEHSSKELSFDSTPRVRTPTVVTRTSRSTTTSTTKKPSKNVPRETSKFVDRARASGSRGSVKYNQSSTKKADTATKK